MSGATVHYEQKRLENDLVALEIFDPEIHAERFVEVNNANPDAFAFVPLPPMATKQDFIKDLYNPSVGTSTDNHLYAIIDKTRSSGKEDINSKYAGIISMVETSASNAITEIGVIIFPDFQRTHVTTNAIGLILLRTLDPPSAGGFGLRRVEWRTNTENAASRKVALRMGFEFEGILKWVRTVANAKVGHSAEELGKRNGTKGELAGRHTAVFAICWDEWEGKRDKVVGLMGRKKSVE